jgi:phosphoribosylformimino-5-aminoimidazole carboxamide ribotide isomerase
MIIYPAIDIQDGKCVRLKRGDFSEVTEFNNDILSQAQIFENAGFEWLHMVDLDGARKGFPVNHDLVKKVASSTSLKIQVGGGIRCLKDVEMMVSCGVSRLILGTIAIKNFSLLSDICKEFPGLIAVGVDARGNKVATHGWQEESDILVFDLILRLEEIGVAAIIYTDINKDGLLGGFDEGGTKQIAQNIKVPIIASGGVSSMADLQKVKAMSDYGVEGVIVGRAFYENKISFANALQL